MSLPLIHHRTKEFQAVLAKTQEGLKKALVTRNPVVIFASSGTGAMEASIANCLSRKDTVLAFTAGKWGERYRDIARAYGLDVEEIKKPYGEAFGADDVARALKKFPRAKAVLMTFCETSTGAVNAVQEMGAAVRKTDALLLVDAISGIGCEPFHTDAWGMDVVVVGSQKGLMLPPGLGFLSLNERAQARMKKSDLPKYYFNLDFALETLKKNDTPFTPAVSLIRGLEEALRLILAEGLEEVWKRHREIAAWVRSQVARMGLECFSKSPSSSLTAIVMPKGVDGTEIVRKMRDDHGVIMANGQGELRGKIVRIAHMGYCSREDARRGMAALEAVAGAYHLR